MTSHPHFPLLLLLLLFLSLSLLPFTTPANLTSDAAALRALSASLRGRWNISAGNNNPCTWQGVRCNNSRVFELHLPGVGFSGQIPAGVFGNLTALNFLSLRFNALTGSIPSDIASCTQLQYIYLQGNQLSGSIPAVLFSLKNLFRLNLAGNRFSGEIPVGFNNLTNLATLFLENNQLTGQIPDLNLPNLKQFNVSYNNLNGSIPLKFCALPTSTFEGNSLSPCPANFAGGGSGVDGGGEGKKSKLSGGAIAGIVIAAVVGLLVIVFLVIVCCRRRNGKETRTRAMEVGPGVAKQGDVEMADDKSVESKERNNSSMEPPAVTTTVVKASGGSGGGKIDKSLVFIANAPRGYDLDDLLRASAEVLGKGAYGTTYKAALENQVVVAVKRLKDVAVPEAEFKEKMEEVGRMQHENLVAFRAYHCSANEKLLVYDYLPMGSLSALLHGNRGGARTPLNWEARSTIALGAARGIAYIHSRSPISSHGNIKSSNILLSNSFEARVSDFGLSQLASPSATPNRVAGYRAPEVTDPRKISQKADVYSFGVFLLELLTGKAPTHALLNEEGVDLPRWVQSVVREEWAAEVFDMELLRYQNVEEEMVQLLQLAVDCTAQYPDNRPSMEEVSTRIEEICRSNPRPEQDLLGDISNDSDNSPYKPS